MLVVFRTSLLFLLNWASTQSAHWYQFSRHKKEQPSIVSSKPHHRNYSNHLRGTVWTSCRDGHDAIPCLQRLWPQFAVDWRLKVQLFQLATLHTCTSAPNLSHLSFFGKFSRVKYSQYRAKYFSMHIPHAFKLVLKSMDFIPCQKWGTNHKGGNWWFNFLKSVLTSISFLFLSNPALYSLPT